MPRGVKLSKVLIIEGRHHGMNVDIQGGEAIVRLLTKKGQEVSAGIRRGLKETAKVVVKEAKKNAPRSPTRAQISATLKVRRRSHAQAMPGGLEKSIQYEVRTSDPKNPCAVVFVPSNSPAGAYAKFIHDEKGKRWYHRGAGTIAKGDQADEKFIERAIQSQSKHFEAIMKNELNKVTK